MDLSVGTFIQGSFQAPFFTNDWPGPGGPFAPPGAQTPLVFVGGETPDAVVLPAEVPAGGGTLEVQLFQRGVPETDLGLDVTPFDLTDSNVGDGMAITLPAALVAALPCDLYFYRFVQALPAGNGGLSPTHVGIATGSFSLVPVSY